MTRPAAAAKPPAGGTGSDGVVTWLLKRAFDHERVYPDSIPLPDGDPDRAVLPALAYRQLTGFRQDYMDRAASGLETATYLIEGFARDRPPCSAVRDKLLDTFAGPCPADPRAGPPDAEAGWEPVEVGGLVIYSATAGDPAADADYGFGELHNRFAFVQVILTLTFLRG